MKTFDQFLSEARSILSEDDPSNYNAKTTNKQAIQNYKSHLTNHGLHKAYGPDHKKTWKKITEKHYNALAGHHAQAKARHVHGPYANANHYGTTSKVSEKHVKKYGTAETFSHDAHKIPSIKRVYNEHGEGKHGHYALRGKHGID